MVGIATVGLYRESAPRPTASLVARHCQPIGLDLAFKPGPEPASRPDLPLLV